MSAANGALAMPYPGLRPFEAEDQPLFFGREAQVGAMLLQLEDHRFVAVVGSSGSGKSSLVRAGLLPAVREGFLLGTTDWLTIIIKPGHQPYQRLVRALSRATCRTEGAQGVPADDDPLTPDATATLAMLRRTDRGLLTVLGELAISPGSRVMIVVDQFEELFAFRRAGVNRDTVTSRDEAAAFVGMLLRSASEPAGRVWAILTMRSDFIGDCEAFLGLPEQISHSQFLVPRLDRRQMAEAIARPAAVEEGTFTTFTFEEGLVNRIINDAGDRPDQLPLMQHALMRTWKHAVARAGTDGPVMVAPEDYETAGGIEMALSLHADAAWNEIKDDPKKAHIARRLFLLLCDILPDGQITRRRPQVAEIQAVTGASVAEIEQVVRVFQRDDRNFLLPPPPQHLTAESYLDISHEALLRQWRLFAGEWQGQERRDASEVPWLDHERRDASELRRLADLASLREQGQGGLLPAQDLERIDRWKQQVSAEWACRYVKEEEWEKALHFVEESRAEVKRDEEQRQKQARQKKALVWAIRFIVLFATVISIFAALYSARKAVLARNAQREAKIALVRANEAKVAAQEALTRSFVRTIGVSYSDEIPERDEQAALWELAELGSANVPVRKRVIDHWFGSGEYLYRALKRQMQGLHAAVGLNVALRYYSASKATEMADRLAKALENQQEPNAQRLQNLSVALATLAARMESKEVGSVSSRGAQVLAKALEDPKTTVSSPLSDFGDALARLAARMEPKEAASVSSRGAQGLVKALEDPKTQAYQLSDLANALAALAARMEPKEAASVSSRGAQVLAKTLEDPKTRAYRLSYRLSDFGDALAALAARMEPKEAASVSSRGAQVLAKTLEDPKTQAYRLSQLGDALAALAARMEPKEAAGVADGLAKALEDPKTEADRLSDLGDALARLAARIEPKEAASVASRGAQVLAKTLEDPKTEAYQLSQLGNVLAALAARMEPKEAAGVADGLAKALEDPKTEADRLSDLGDALARLAARIEPKEAASVASRGAQVLAKPLEDAKTEAARLSDLGNALAALAARMEPKEAAGVSSRGAQVLAKPLENAKTEAARLSDLGNALAALAARMEPKEAAGVSSRGAQVLVKALEDPNTEADRLSQLGDALAALAARMEPQEAAGVSSRGAQVLAEALEDPQRTDTLRLSRLGWTFGQLSSRIPSARQTRWVAVSILMNQVPMIPKVDEVEPEKRRYLVAYYKGIGNVFEAEAAKLRKQLADLFALIEAQELAEVLKWPFCVGEVEKIALAELEKKTGRKFDGNIWKFVEEAPSLGIKDLDAPAKRPKVKDALTELNQLQP